ncbi:hypothetical protein [Rhizobium sp. 10PS4]|nr:hypothetical protein [Rhizobium sp. 10PS4]MDU0309903.1 hypothetical protein [Rhizobium sp. 10PS4]
MEDVQRFVFPFAERHVQRTGTGVDQSSAVALPSLYEFHESRNPEPG